MWVQNPAKCLVYTVVYDLPDKMVQALFSGIAYVHRWPFPYGLKSIQNFYLFRTV